MDKFNSFQIKIANRVVKICPMFHYIKSYCKDYIVDDNLQYDFKVTTTQEDINFEREKAKKQSLVENTKMLDYSDSYLETLSVYRKIAVEMLKYNTFLFHGSVIAVDGQGYLFTAVSGTGKSTHTKLWQEHFGNRAVMVNDDKPLISVEQNTVTAHGTPWNGKHRIGCNISVPLKAICLLTRDVYNHIEPISNVDIYSIILQQSYRPKQAELLVKYLDIVDIVLKNCKFYKLGCNMEADAPVVAYNGMNK